MKYRITSAALAVCVLLSGCSSAEKKPDTSTAMEDLVSVATTSATSTGDAAQQTSSVPDKPADEPGLSKVASIETIKGQDYILTPNRYIEMKKETVQHSSLEKLAEQLNRVSAEKGAVKLTINKKMASDLGLMPLIKLLQEGAQTSKELNEQFKDDGIALSDESIVTLTNSKTFKIEVKKWDKLPAIVVMFAQMWKQLMITCNNEENRYLMELKDIMLERYFG